MTDCWTPPTIIYGYINSGYVNIRSARAPRPHRARLPTSRYGKVGVTCWATDGNGALWDYLFDYSRSPSIEGYVLDSYVFTGGNINEQIHQRH